MTTKEAIKAVLDFKSLMINLINENGDRTAINQNLSIIKRILYIAGTHKALTIAPPPMVGGLMMQNVDPLDIIFNVPYGMEDDLYNTIIDMMDETIGVLKANPTMLEQYEEKIKKRKENEKETQPVVLVKGNVEILSDINGFAYIGIDNEGFWKIKVAQKLKACGYGIDMNKIL